MTVTSYLRHE